MERPDEPRATGVTPGELLADYLDYYREDIAAVLDGLAPDERGQSRVPSGWTAASLANHLLHVERRWFQWGFLAEDVPDPWGDHEHGEKSNPRWVASERPLAEVLADWRAAGTRTRELLTTRALGERARTGGRFPDEASAPDLQWIAAHVLQEYARHAGHLDIVTELTVADR